MSTNLTAILYGKDDLRLEETPIPEPLENQVLIRIDSVGICGSDVHYWTHGRIGDFVVNSPMIIGHEASGTIEKLGEKVKNLSIGDRVAVEPGVPCRQCLLCKSGTYNLCPEMSFCATPPVNGNLRQFYAHDADFVHKLPDSVSLEEGALIEPLSVGVHGCRRGRISLGSSVLICGAGPIGLSVLLVAKAMGSSLIVVTDISKERLAVATKCGAHFTYLITENESSFQMSQKLRHQFTKNFGFDATIECTGVESSIQFGILCIRTGGTFVLIGLGDTHIRLPLLSISVKEIDIRGVFRYANCYPVAIQMLASNKINLEPLITHRFAIKETLKAFSTAKFGLDGAIKILIKVNQ